jgi:hypothetical protein
LDIGGALQVEGRVGSAAEVLVLTAKLPVFPKLLAKGEGGNHAVVPGRGHVGSIKIGKLTAHQRNRGNAKPTLKQLLLVGEFGSVGAPRAGRCRQLVADHPEVSAQGGERNAVAQQQRVVLVGLVESLDAGFGVPRQKARASEYVVVRLNVAERGIVAVCARVSQGGEGRKLEVPTHVGVQRPVLG